MHNTNKSGSGRNDIEMNEKFLSLLMILSLLLLPVASGYAMPYNKMMMSDTPIKKDMSMNTTMEKMKHANQKNISNPDFFNIDDTTIKMKRGEVTISGHGAYNPVQGTIYGWGTYSIDMGSRVIKGTWTATHLADVKGNPYAGESNDSHVHFIGMTINNNVGKDLGNNAKKESVKRGAHQLWISANALEGKLCVYGNFVGTPSPRNACVTTDTISITH